MSCESAPLSEICQEDSPITYGILQPGPEVEDGVPYVRPSEIKGGQIDISSIRRTSPEIADRYKKSVIHEGDILITIVGTIGHIAIVPSDLDGGNITQSSARIRVCQSKADQSYVKNFLRSPLATRQYDRHRLGVAVARLNLHHVRDLQIPLPPLAEQKRIAGILDAADALRAKRRESLAQLDALLQSTFLDMFGDPVANPMGWEVKALADFCKTGTGGTPSRKEMKRYYEDGTIPWVKSGELRELVITETGEHVTETALQETSVKLVPKHALLLALYGATVGRLGILGIEATTNQAVCHIIPDMQAANLTYMFHALSNQVSYLVGRGVGGAQPNISQGIVKALDIPLPPLDLQKRFAAIVDSVERQKATQRAHLDELDTLFASLQSRAFRGDL